MIHLGESGRPVFRGTSALSRGRFSSEGGRKTSIHDNGDSATAEFLFRIFLSVNQLSVYGAVSNWYEELAQWISDHSFFPIQGDLLRN